MMLNFCLMTTANYLTKALVMYDSLKRVCGNNFHLYYYTFDKSTFNMLNQLSYKQITPVSLETLENADPELKKIKSKRTKSEYFFTCTPQILDHALNSFNLENIIYVDADLFFYEDPNILIDEMPGKTVMITEHRYFPPVDKHPSGHFCVQFVPFYNNTDGREVLTDWKKKCLDWCYLRAEDGKWADQGYLNKWPEDFKQVHIMQHPGGGLASWNVDRYKFEPGKPNVKVYDTVLKDYINLIFFHFHGLKIYKNGLMVVGIPKKNKNAMRFIYKSYIKKLSEKETEIIKQLNIKREMFNYEVWGERRVVFYLKEIRRLLSPRKRDLYYRYKIGGKYRWLP